MNTISSSSSLPLLSRSMSPVSFSSSSMTPDSPSLSGGESVCLCSCVCVGGWVGGLVVHAYVGVCMRVYVCVCGWAYDSRHAQMYSSYLCSMFCVLSERYIISLSQHCLPKDAEKINQCFAVFTVSCISSTTRVCSSMCCC